MTTNGEIGVGRSRFERRLGQVLVEGGFITKEHLEQAKEQVQREGKRLVSVLQERGWASRDILTTVLSFHLKVPVADPRQVEIDYEVAQLISEEVALECMALPFDVRVDGTLRVLMEDPGDFNIVNRLDDLTGRQIRPVLPLGEGFRETIQQVYGVIATQRIAQQQLAGSAADIIIFRAIKSQATGIHILPSRDVVVFVNGVRQEGEGPQLPPDLYKAVVARIKELARMDVTETQQSQEGRFTRSLENRTAEFLVSIFPYSDGEEGVILRVVHATLPP